MVKLYFYTASLTAAAKSLFLENTIQTLNKS